jgi:hypothetical protein
MQGDAASMQARHWTLELLARFFSPRIGAPPYRASALPPPATLHAKHNSGLAIARQIWEFPAGEFGNFQSVGAAPRGGAVPTSIALAMSISTRVALL